MKIVLIVLLCVLVKTGWCGAPTVTCYSCYFYSGYLVLNNGDTLKGRIQVYDAKWKDHRKVAFHPVSGPVRLIGKEDISQMRLFYHLRIGSSDSVLTRYTDFRNFYHDKRTLWRLVAVSGGEEIYDEEAFPQKEEIFAYAYNPAFDTDYVAVCRKDGIFYRKHLHKRPTMKGPS